MQCKKKPRKYWKKEENIIGIHKLVDCDKKVFTHFAFALEYDVMAVSIQTRLNANRRSKRVRCQCSASILRGYRHTYRFLSIFGKVYVRRNEIEHVRSSVTNANSLISVN